jgi:hypothetical protein
MRTAIPLQQNGQLMPDEFALDLLPVPDSSLEGDHVQFDQVRHELDQQFEGYRASDPENPEQLSRQIENESHIFLV